MTSAYYNEIDPYAAQWLRNLIAAGHIAPGDVDERSIEDVKPDDLRNYTQCHFFAGIGVWSYALRNAGWPDDKPVWTGSCPCQPFSAAGKGDGFDDERHLWPHFHWLISECRPEHVFGEQVASGNANAWFDLVQADLEAMDYAFGIVPFPSAGVGAPHIRDRAYWVANTNSERWNGSWHQGASGWDEYPIGSNTGWVADSNDNRQQPGSRGSCGGKCAPERDNDRWCREACGLADTPGQRHNRRWITDRCAESDCRTEAPIRGEHGEEAKGLCEVGRGLPSAVNGFWRDADWLFCRDEKWRPVRPGSFPLVDGATSRVGRLRAYGNAINAEAAQTFINAYMEIINGKD